MFAQNLDGISCMNEYVVSYFGFHEGYVHFSQHSLAEIYLC